MQDEVRILQGYMSPTRMKVLMLQLLSSSNKLMTPYLRKTEGALCETLFAGQGAYLEGVVTFPHMYRTSRISGRLAAQFWRVDLAALVRVMDKR